MPTNESQLVTQIQKALRKRWPNAWVFKVVGNPYQESGVPDILAVVDGLTCGIEVKHQKPGESEQHARERTSALQRVQIQRIIRAGGIAGTALSSAEAIEIIERGLRRRGERHGT